MNICIYREPFQRIRIYSMLIKDFVDLIENLLDKYSHVKIEAMGFPENWKEILIK